MLKDKVFIVLLLLPFLFGCSNEKNKPQREVNIQKDEYDLMNPPKKSRKAVEE